MKAEDVVQLYDSFWFGLPIFKEIPNSSTPPADPDRQIQEKPSDRKFSLIPTINSRSMSDDSFKLESFSPDSVLQIPSLNGSSGNDVAENSKLMSLPKRKRLTKRRKHKSLSELEFEELKGFMDLGFVFSEEDRDSSLASFIPGLQRLGKKTEEEDGFDESVIQRPYLSETWEVLERKMKEKPLMNWRIPAASSEVSMKDNLKWWAHAVASTVMMK